MLAFTKDLYFQPEYISLYRGSSGEVFSFEYQSGDRHFGTRSLKRPIPEIENPSMMSPYFDLETAYGFGGFVTNTDNKEFIAEAFAKYQQACRAENIVAEFVRFHPLNSFPIHQSEFLSFAAKERQTVYLDLTLSKEDQWALYGQNTRNLLRRCEATLTFNVESDLGRFMELYEQTMDRNRAGEFYYFDEAYFKKFLGLPGVELWSVYHESKPISMGFFIFGEQIAYYHLSGNSPEALKLNANYYLLEKMRERAKNLSKQVLFLGGGRTSSPEDSLYRFKSKFSPLRWDFYIGGVVHNQEAYDSLLRVFHQKHPEKAQAKIFLKYRMQ
jgi:hypothetical protein